jgi:hypothetical protein
MIQLIMELSSLVCELLQVIFVTALINTCPIIRKVAYTWRAYIWRGGGGGGIFGLAYSLSIIVNVVDLNIGGYIGGGEGWLYFRGLQCDKKATER